MSQRKYLLDSSRLIKIFFAIQSRKRVGCEECVCQRCRNCYDTWRRDMKGDFDDIDASATNVEQDEVAVNVIRKGSVECYTSFSDLGDGC
jgi:hypothetical protein